MVGCCPGRAFATDWIAAWRPFSCVDLEGTVWEPMIEASNSRSPCGWWQEAHAESSAWGPPGWAPFAFVTQSMLSWHEPHAARDGYVYQTFDCVASGVWHR